MSEIAKYRKEGFPSEWFLTDFTMEQVEDRITYLESQYSALITRHNALVEAVAWLRECSKFHADKAVFYLDTWWENEVFNSLEAARAEVDRLIGEVLCAG